MKCPFHDGTISDAFLEVYASLNTPATDTQMLKSSKIPDIQHLLYISNHWTDIHKVWIRDGVTKRRFAGVVVVVGGLSTKLLEPMCGDPGSEVRLYIAGTE